MKGLIIKSPWIEKILAGEKTWEIRGSNTKIRGTIALIKSGTGMIYGSVELVETLPVDINQYDHNRDKHRVDVEGFWGFVHYNQPWAWVMENPIKYDTPIPYKHPQGAVIWVNL